MTSGRKQTSVYKDNDVSEFHFENYGIHSQFSGKSHSSMMLTDVILYIANFGKLVKNLKEYKTELYFIIKVSVIKIDNAWL